MRINLIQMRQACGYDTMLDAECSIALPCLTLGVNRSALPYPHPPDRRRVLSIERQRATDRQIVDDQDQAVIAGGRGGIEGQRLCPARRQIAGEASDLGSTGVLR